jgi:diaminopimelate decarboxylase
VIELPAPVRVAAAAARGPALVFDVAAIEARLDAVAAAARRHDVRALFAVKAFPHRRVVELAAARLDGLDLAGPEERALAAGSAAARVSITDPGLDAAGLPPGPIAVTCESVDQVRAVRAARPDAAIALRVSMSALVPGDAAVGALQAGDGHHRSRFGVEPDAGGGWPALAAMVEAARGARLGLFAHSAGVVPASPARWAAIARALIEVAGRAGIAPAFVDLGGSWHGVAGALDAALAAVRAAVPATIEVVIEPGRLIALGAGYAVGRVLAARALADRTLCVASISRIAHLRWSAVELVGPAPRPGRGAKVTVAGPTCFEDDVIGDWVVEAAPPAGAPIAWSGVTGYSVAWNRGFAGVPAADVVLVEGQALRQWVTPSRRTVSPNANASSMSPPSRNAPASSIDTKPWSHAVRRRAADSAWRSPTRPVRRASTGATAAARESTAGAACAPRSVNRSP